MRRKSLAVLCLLATLVAARVCEAQKYSADLDDIKRIYSGGAPSHIGDYGKVTKVLKFKEFVPISAVSKKRDTFFTLDIFQYYRFPLRSTLRQLYHGPKEFKRIPDGDDGSPVPKDYDEVTKYFEDVDMPDLEWIFGEDAEWMKFAEQVTRGESGERLYRGIFGKAGGFEGAEPIAILFTDRNAAFVIVNLRWSSANRNGTGQTLFALEFAKGSGEYKDVHVLYNTANPNTTNRAFMEATQTMVEAAVKHYLKKL